MSDGDVLSGHSSSSSDRGISFSQRTLTVNETHISLIQQGLDECFSPPPPTDISQLDLNKYKFVKKKTFSLSSNKIGGFTFIEYYPEIFHALRVCRGISTGSELLSAVGTGSRLATLFTNSKSGQFFLQSIDGTYILKTISKQEYHIFRRMLLRYYTYLRDNPNSLLVRILGLYRVKQGSYNLYFILMRNVVANPCEHPAHELYDLKGSLVGRKASPSEMNKSSPVFKDLDFEDVSIDLGSRHTDELLSALHMDVEFLASLQLMDYSVFIGVHYTSRCDTSHSSVSSISVDGEEVYYIGIIDLFTKYTTKKKLEHMFKSIIHDSKTISSISPQQYAVRLYEFIRQHMDKC